MGKIPIFSRTRTQKKLTKVQQKQLYKMITDGPEKNGFACGVSMPFN